MDIDETEVWTKEEGALGSNVSFSSPVLYTTKWKTYLLVSSLNEAIDASLESCRGVVL